MDRLGVHVKPVVFGPWSLLWTTTLLHYKGGELASKLAVVFLLLQNSYYNEFQGTDMPKSTTEKPFKEFIKPTDKYILSSWCKGKCGINGSYGGVTGKNNTPLPKKHN